MLWLIKKLQRSHRLQLFEPERYPGAGALPLFESIFGPAPRCRVCAIGFEPNPRHAPRLTTLQANLGSAGAGVLIFEAAAGTVDGVLPLTLGARKSAFEDAGASTLGIGRYKDPQQVLVRMIKLERIIRHVHHELRGGSGRILMKLDIEGSEWTVLPELMASGALCLVQRVYIEYHGADFNRMAQAKMQRRIQRAGYRVMGGVLDHVRLELNATLSTRPGARACGTSLATLDDETYLHDGKPWPQRPICM